MPEKKISDLQAKTTIAGTEELEINDSGTSKKITTTTLHQQIQTEIDDIAAEIAQFKLDLAALPTPLFPVWAEENGTYGNNAYEWAFGNGQDSQPNGGFALFRACKLVGMTLTSRNGGTPIVEIYKNGSSTGYQVQITSGNKGSVDFATPLNFAADDEIVFRTVTANGGGYGTVVAYFEPTS